DRPALELAAHGSLEQWIARLQAVVGRGSLLARDDEPGISKRREVTRHTGLRGLHDLGELADRKLLRQERAQELEPRLVAERAEAVDPVGGGKRLHIC